MWHLQTYRLLRVSPGLPFVVIIAILIRLFCCRSIVRGLLKKE